MRRTKVAALSAALVNAYAVALAIGAFGSVVAPTASADGECMQIAYSTCEEGATCTVQVGTPVQRANCGSKGDCTINMGDCNSNCTLNGPQSICNIEDL